MRFQVVRGRRPVHLLLDARRSKRHATTGIVCTHLAANVRTAIRPFIAVHLNFLQARQIMPAETDFDVNVALDHNAVSNDIYPSVNIFECSLQYTSQNQYNKTRTTKAHGVNVLRKNYRSVSALSSPSNTPFTVTIKI